ncbi:hypothetical protein [Flavobacterium laiguense]|uniref:Uncharacterized protein n=1 Tax=Flavobacterium laiguense TaxID=2169409 RepID=A0A2U1JVI6_9FLAO|nr:hypothetical protein [Flavobacterium laiguense]PWA08969.1 hypothetical protein DB891_09975 [Flavobacterium laiguense]
MGFFKKIGAAVKKGVKQISLKNIVKVGTPLLSMIPIVGGLAQDVVGGISAAAAKKKEAKQAAEAGRIEEANALNAQANYLASLSGGQVGQQVGAQLNAFTKGVTQEAIAQTSKGFKQDVGLVGANVADSTMTEWLKMHWIKLAVGFGVIGGAIYMFMRKGNNSNSRRR